MQKYRQLWTCEVTFGELEEDVRSQEYTVQQQHHKTKTKQPTAAAMALTVDCPKSQ